MIFKNDAKLPRKKDKDDHLDLDDDSGEKTSKLPNVEEFENDDGRSIVGDDGQDQLNVKHLSVSPF